MGLRILYNSLDPAHKLPFGVLTPEETCQLTIAIPRSCQTVRVILVLERGKRREIPGAGVPAGSRRRAL